MMDFANLPKERPRVSITEVGTRDGFQVEPVLIPAEVKAEVIDALIAAGVRHLEATSFVSPRAVPQLADAHDVLAQLRRSDHAECGRECCATFAVSASWRRRIRRQAQPRRPVATSTRRARAAARLGRSHTTRRAHAPRQR